MRRSTTGWSVDLILFNNEIRAVILDYYKTIRPSQEPAFLDVDNIWRKGGSYKGKGKSKGHHKGRRRKGKYRQRLLQRIRQGQQRIQQPDRDLGLQRKRRTDRRI